MNTFFFKSPLPLFSTLSLMGAISLTQCKPTVAGVSQQESFKSTDGSPITLTVRDTGTQFQTADGISGFSAITYSTTEAPSQLQVSQSQLCPLQVGAQISFMEWDVVSDGYIKILDTTPIQISNNGNGPSSCKLSFSFVKLTDFVEADDLMLVAKNVPEDSPGSQNPVAKIESQVDSTLNTEESVLESLPQNAAPQSVIPQSKPSSGTSTASNSSYDAARAKKIVASARSNRMSQALRGKCYAATSRVLLGNGMDVWSISAPHRNNHTNQSTISMYPSDLLDYLTVNSSDVCKKYHFKVFGNWSSKLDPRDAPIGSVMIYRPRYGSGCTVHPVAGHIEVKVASDQYISDGYRSGQCNFVSAYMVPVKSCN